MTDDMKIRVSLLSLRLGVAAVFLAWTIDRIVNYAHNSGMMAHYYHVQISEPILMVMGIVELLLVLAFLAGKFKTYSYGFILIAHSATTIASSWRLLPPYEIHQLLYFGSLPMLGACIALFLLRDKDTLFTI
jgi:uncharacterized membrane protein